MKQFRKWLYNFRKSSHAFMMLSALVVGVGTALVAVGFILSINGLAAFLARWTSEARWLLLFLPATGALLVGVIVKYMAPEAKGHGIPEVMLSVAVNRGLIRPVVVLAKTIGSIITIGTGASAGREGPIVQIGAAIGSAYSQFMKLGENRTITLLSAGAAAGIAATFNAPVAGVLFASEVIMKNTGVKEFGALVVAAVGASFVSHAFLGNEPAFHIPPYQMSSELELPLYLLLGVISAVLGVAFIRCLLYFEETFDGSKKIPDVLKPFTGALFYGPLLFFFPLLYGGGFPGIELALDGKIPFLLLGALAFMKILGTSLCLGSGSSGGVFAPALFIGAMAGGAFGKMSGVIFPEVATESGAYAIIGMAAVFAASARAPVTAILMLFEMTRDYNMILPLMFATVVSTALAEWLFKESIYTCKLKARGIDIAAGDNTNILRLVKVAETMTPFEACFTVPPYIPLRDLEAHFSQYHKRKALVIDTGGDFHGVATIKSLYGAKEIIDVGVVADICEKTITLFPDDTIEDAAGVFASSDIESIPVVSFENPRECLGEFTRENLANAYSRTLMDIKFREKHLKNMKLSNASRTRLFECEIEENDFSAGKKISQLNLPPNCNIVAIYRASGVVSPRGATELRPGDTLIALCGDEESLLSAIKG